jgi:hypothetical protein
MSTQSYSSPKIQWAKDRHSKLKSIAEQYDFGKNYNVTQGTTVISELQAEQDKLNDMKSVLDAQRMLVAEKEKAVNDFYVGALARVASEHGDDSKEYEKAGGTPKSKRKAPVRKAPSKKELAAKAKESTPKA